MKTCRKKKGRKNGEDRKTIMKWKHNFLLNKQTSFFAVIALSLSHGSSNNYSAHYAIFSTEFHYLVGYISCLLRPEMIKRSKQWPMSLQKYNASLLLIFNDLEHIIYQKCITIQERIELFLVRDRG